MSDTRPTNEQIADLLLNQTFSERMELAEWLRECLNDAKADMESSEGFDASSIAALLEIWATAELEPEQP